MSKKKIIWFVLMIIVMIVIFIFSNQSGETSHAISNAVADKVKIQPQNEWVEASSTPLIFGLNLRNWAHIGLYAALGFTTVMWICSWWGAGLICYGFACFDELHQLFVGTRGASITDTFLDTIGFGVVILMWFMIVRIVEKKKCSASRPQI
jgi:VanZ family protein